MMHIVTTLVESIQSVEAANKQTTTDDSEGATHPLDTVSKQLTVEDVVNAKSVSSKLPGFWDVEFDIHTTSDNDMKQCVVIGHTPRLPEYRLIPVDADDPLGMTEIIVKNPSNSKTSTVKRAESLKEGFIDIKRRTEKIEERIKTEFTEVGWNEAGPSSAVPLTPETTETTESPIAPETPATAGESGEPASM